MNSERLCDGVCSHIGGEIVACLGGKAFSGDVESLPSSFDALPFDACATCTRLRGATVLPCNRVDVAGVDEVVGPGAVPSDDTERDEPGEVVAAYVSRITKVEQIRELLFGAWLLGYQLHELVPTGADSADVGGVQVTDRLRQRQWIVRHEPGGALGKGQRARGLHGSERRGGGREAKLKDVKGRGCRKLAQALADSVVEGNRYDRLNGRTRYGTTVARLKNPRTGAYKGLFGPPLAPHGASSRVITHFRARVNKRAGEWQVLAGWQGVQGRSGYPFLVAHDLGLGRLPARPIFGMSPRTSANNRKLLAEWASTAMRGR